MKHSARPITFAVTLLTPLALLLTLLPLHANAMTVAEAMDAVVSRMYETLSLEELYALDDAAVHAFITPEEREAFATRYHHFEVDVPVVVSLMRETGQSTLPFWLEESGFEKTDLEVTNTAGWTYEVWQKAFDAGTVALGINGFDRHRPHYFVSVAPQNQDDSVTITELFPDDFSIGHMHSGSFVYHDWTSLLLDVVPAELRGQQMLRTIRGRAREVNFIGGFRETPHPSTVAPQQVVLTWNGDTQSTQAIQWRTNTEVTDGVVQYRVAGSGDEWEQVVAGFTLIEDTFLANDRFCHRYEATLTGLTPGTEYEYRVGSPAHGEWSEEYSFSTASSDPESPITFITFGDTHQQEPWGAMLHTTLERHPEVAFYAIAGDQVNTGQWRDHWDTFFGLADGVFSRRPILTTIGNHDAIDGLGAGMYRSMFALPENGPEPLPKQNAYAIEYGNVLYISLDSSSRAIDQAAWLEEVLANTEATWKVAMFHFPPYSIREPYPEIRSLWGYLFDKYHVDFVMTGHFHYYMRSHPLFRDDPQESPADGTIHVMSISFGDDRYRADLPPQDYAAVQFAGLGLYQLFQVEGNRLVYQARDADGTVHDEVVIEK